jgi:adenine/guanine phosphoribosyltransferase-like PRPP-binding protein
VAALAAWKFPEGIDGVVAIASGGIVPGALVAQKIGVELKTIAVSYRNAINEPQFPQPILTSSVPGLGGWRRALLVDDFYLSGQSWDTARAHLPKTVEILPFVLIGEVDFALFRRTPGAVRWPWSAE